jgi:hypothetical protein
LTDDQVREIRARFEHAAGPTKRGGRRNNARELAAEFGVGFRYIVNIAYRHERAEVV